MSTLEENRTLGCFSFGGGLKIIFSLLYGVFLRARNLGDRRGILSLFVFWNLGDRRGEIDSSSLFSFGDFVGVMLSIIEVHKGSKRAGRRKEFREFTRSRAITTRYNSKVQSVQSEFVQAPNSVRIHLCLGAKIASVTLTMLRS